MLGDWAVVLVTAALVVGYAAVMAWIIDTIYDIWRKQ